MEVSRSLTGGSAPRPGLMGAWVVFALLLAAGLLFLADARAALAQSTQDAGYRDFSFAAPAGSSTPFAPTGEKPQSKLWFNDGIWWGSLFDGTPEAGEDPSGQYEIFRFDKAAQRWTETNVALDIRNTSKADTLWDDRHLYVATAMPPGTSSGDANAHLLRYSYDPGTKKYTRDPGFPKVVATGGMEAIVLDKDSTGKFWVTYTQRNPQGAYEVFVNRSTSPDGAAWGTPFVLPVEGTTIGRDEISAVIRYDGKIGVMWSDQDAGTMYFATHRDGDPDGTWQGGVAVRCPRCAEDHINLASLEADASGRVFAVIKTLNHYSPSGPVDPNAPLIWLLVLGADGTWKPPAVFGRVRDNHTRPIVKIDQTNRKLYVFAASPWPDGGAIYFKRANLADTISFPEGLGTPFIQSSIHTKINNVTSTKQNLNFASTGLLILASDDPSNFYLHNIIELVPPTVTLTAPNDGERVRGSVTLSADASDNAAVERVEFLVNGAVVATDTSAPYSASWNSASTAGGAATISARAFDTSGNDATSTSRTVTVEDSTAPTVTAISPASGATRVPATTNVTATFSEAMNPASLTTTTVTLVKKGTTTPVAAAVRCDSPCRNVTLDPSVSLAKKKNYTATVKGGADGARDAAGNPLAANRVWSFKTK